MTTEMSITRALVELKTLDSRIQKLTQQAVFVGIKGELRKRKDEVGKAASNYDKLRDLRKRRHRLKSAIVLSNATCQIEICGEKMSKAEAIEMKSSIKNDKSLLSVLRRQYGDAQAQMERENERVKRVLESSLSQKTDDKGLDVEIYSKSFMKMNGVSIDDPIKIQDKIAELDAYITEFESQVDFVLSESNAVTKISIQE